VTRRVDKVDAGIPTGVHRFDSFVAVEGSKYPTEPEGAKAKP